MMIDDFLDMESSLDLFSREIKGFHYWIYIRDKIYSKISDLEPQTNDSNVAYAKMDGLFSSKVMELSNKKIQFRDVVNVIINITINNPLLYNKKHDIVFIPSPRRILYDGKYYAIWTDALAELYKDCSITCEFLNITDHMTPYWHTPVLELDYFDVHPVIQSRINHRMKNTIKHEVDLASKEIIDIISDRFNFSLAYEYVYNLIETRYIWHEIKKKLFTSFLLKMKPKILFEVSGYSTNNLVLNEVAKELSITTIELQHGIIGKDHIGYNYKTNIKMEQHPDYLFVFSDYWKNTCRFPIGEDHIIPMGYPYAELQMERYPWRQSDNNTIRILVLSQPIFYKEQYGFTEQVLNELNKRGISYSLVYKLHPTEYSQPISKWGNITAFKNVSIANTTDKSLYEYFSNTDVQLGVTSTSIFEGLLYNLNTYIIKAGNSEVRMKDICEMGYAKFCESPEDFVDMISTRTSTKCEEESKFFKGHSLERMKLFIDSIL